MLAAALLALTCSTYEAQFSSTVKEVFQIENDPYSCHLTLDLDLSRAGQSFRPHFLCPLDIDEVSNQKIYSTNCEFNKGDKISGYLIKTSERIELE